MLCQDKDSLNSTSLPLCTYLCPDHNRYYLFSTYVLAQFLFIGIFLSKRGEKKICLKYTSRQNVPFFAAHHKWLIWQRRLKLIQFCLAFFDSPNCWIPSWGKNSMLAVCSQVISQYLKNIWKKNVRNFYKVLTILCARLPG